MVSAVLISNEYSADIGFPVHKSCWTSVRLRRVSLLRLSHCLRLSLLRRPSGQRRIGC